MPFCPAPSPCRRRFCCFPQLPPSLRFSVWSPFPLRSVCFSAPFPPPAKPDSIILPCTLAFKALNFNSVAVTASLLPPSHTSCLMTWEIKLPRTGTNKTHYSQEIRTLNTALVATDPNLANVLSSSNVKFCSLARGVYPQGLRECLSRRMLKTKARERAHGQHKLGKPRREEH